MCDNNGPNYTRWISIRHSDWSRAFPSSSCTFTCTNLCHITSYRKPNSALASDNQDHCWSLYKWLSILGYFPAWYPRPLWCLSCQETHGPLDRPQTCHNTGGCRRSYTSKGRPQGTYVGRLNRHLVQAERAVASTDKHLTLHSPHQIYCLPGLSVAISDAVADYIHESHCVHTTYPQLNSSLSITRCVREGESHAKHSRRLAHRRLLTYLSRHDSESKYRQVADAVSR